jgi:mono/diheme cytochrome c family protein
VIVDGNVPPTVSSCAIGNQGGDLIPNDDQQHVVNMLRGTEGPGVTLDSTIRAYALAEQPMGLWVDKPECDWSKEPWKTEGPTLDEKSATDPRPWMANLPQGATGQSHVYSELPGAAIFGMVCINCHGPKFDSVGRLADNLATLTGGHARVANLRDGLFGAKGANRASVFGAVATPDVTADDWGARYLSWMTLGGTSVTIPSEFLASVGRTLFFGEVRDAAQLPVPHSANMLSLGRALCMDSLMGSPYDFNNKRGYFESKPNAALLWHSGDAEMWLKICSINNPPPVFGYIVDFIAEPPKPGQVAPPIAFPTLLNRYDETGGSAVTSVVIRRDVFNSSKCNGTCLVGDERAGVAALDTANLHPWCVAYAWDTQNPSVLDPWLASKCVSGADCNAKGDCVGPDCVHPPKCPVDGSQLGPSGDAYTKSQAKVPHWTIDGWDLHGDDQGNAVLGDAALAWARRGAMNAGLAVFLYLDRVAKGEIVPKTTFDHCEQLVQPQ